MSLVAILLPMFAQVLLTFVLLGWMSLLRLRVVRRGDVSPQQVALREPVWPPHVMQVGNAFQNQLELPMLFYVVILLALATDALDVTLYVLSWMFVLSRYRAQLYPCHLEPARPAHRRVRGRRHRALSHVGDRHRPHHAVRL